MQVETLLVVDPESTTITAVLKGSGYRVLHTKFFDEAVEIVEASNPRINLVICSYDLGTTITGIELIERLQEISPDLKYILISRTDDDALRSDPGFQKHSAHFLIAQPRRES